MVDAQSLTEDALQALHHLYRQCYLGQQVEHLLVLLECMLDEVDVEFGLSGAGDAVQQGDGLAHHGHQEGVVGVLLGGGEGVYEVGTVVAAVVQAAHLFLVRLEQLSALQLAQGVGGGLAGIHQLLAGDLHGLCAVLYEVPARQCEVAGEGVQLSLGTRQHVKGDVQGGGRLVLGAEAYVGLRLGTVAVLGLQPGGQGGLVDVARGGEVVVADPLPQRELAGEDQGPVVEHLQQGLHLVALGLPVVHTGHKTYVALRASEADQHAHALLYRHALGHGIGEQGLQRHRQYHVSVGHRDAKLTLS